MLEYSMEYTLQYMLEYSLEYTLQYMLEYSLEYTLEYKMKIGKCTAILIYTLNSTTM